MSARVTDWIASEQRPTLPGVYELEDVQYPFHYWDGEHWCACAGATPDDPELSGDSGKLLYTKYQYPYRKRWRGLAEDPSAQAAPQGKEGGGNAD